MPDSQPSDRRRLSSAADDERLYFRQLLAGRDFAVGDPIAAQMVNFVYLIGDRVTGEALVVDPAYGIDDLLGILADDEMTCAGALATHYHADHIGGDMMGYGIEGITRLLEAAPVPVHVQAAEVPWVSRSSGVTEGDLVAHDGGDVVTVGEIPVTLVHTPGHTPGSQCFLVGERLVSGDTLFLDGCGRTDFPGGDSVAMFESLHTRLARVPDDTVLYPGHMYSPDPSASMGDTRQRNYVFRPKTPEQWLAMFGA
ncbi:MAG TPA: MBL fold metallo-hydrolase [Acidimicrobiales bacterium]|nr:MBL fold metallo-hydrolase [Acidimicrobiales bacterium]